MTISTLRLQTCVTPARRVVVGENRPRVLCADSSRSKVSLHLFTLFAAVALSAEATSATPLTIPFDFQRGEVAVAATIRSAPVYGFLDSGVDPSVVDLRMARRLHLKIEYGSGGEVSGEGKGHVTAFPTAIEGLAIQGRSFEPVPALTSDLSTISGKYGRSIDIVLGYSFLNHRRVLIDYSHLTVSLLDRAEDADAIVNSCRQRFQLPMMFLKDLNWPVIPAFQFGSNSGRATLDTGSNGGVALYRNALAMPGLKSALRETGVVTHAGARGEAAPVKSYALGVPIGFGPFMLPAGQAVTLGDDSLQPDAPTVAHRIAGTGDERVANVGNRLFAAMKLKMLLDYKARQIAFWGDCK